jgi:hypothetical protein
MSYRNLGRLVTNINVGILLLGICMGDVLGAVTEGGRANGAEDPAAKLKIGSEHQIQPVASPIASDTKDIKLAATNQPDPQSDPKSTDEKVADLKEVCKGLMDLNDNLCVIVPDVLRCVAQTGVKPGCDICANLCKDKKPILKNVCLNVCTAELAKKPGQPVNPIFLKGICDGINAEIKKKCKEFIGNVKKQKMKAVESSQ